MQLQAHTHTHSFPHSVHAHAHAHAHTHTTQNHPMYPTPHRPVFPAPPPPVGVTTMANVGTVFRSSAAPASAAPSTATPTPTPAPLRVRKERRSGKAAKKVRSSRSNVPGESRYWTPSEHKLFVEALLRFGPKNLKEISASVGTRNMIQCRTHSQKCFQRLLREAQKETARRLGMDHSKAPKDVYSVSSTCGIALLCVVSEEMTRALQS